MSVRRQVWKMDTSCFLRAVDDAIFEVSSSTNGINTIGSGSGSGSGSVVPAAGMPSIAEINKRMDR